MRLAEYRALFLPAIYSATSFFNAHARGMFWGPRSKVARLKPRRARVRGRGNAKAKERERERDSYIGILWSKRELPF